MCSQKEFVVNIFSLIILLIFYLISIYFIVKIEISIKTFWVQIVFVFDWGLELDDNTQKVDGHRYAILYASILCVQASNWQFHGIFQCLRLILGYIKYSSLLCTDYLYTLKKKRNPVLIEFTLLCYTLKQR